MSTQKNCKRKKMIFWLPEELCKVKKCLFCSLGNFRRENFLFLVPGKFQKAKICFFDLWKIL